MSYPSPEIVRLAERDLVRDRLGFFAVVWAAASGFWLLVLARGPEPTLGGAAALGILGFQAAVFAAALGVVRRDVGPAADRGTLVACIAALAATWAVVAAALAARWLEVVALVLPILVCVPPLFFAWSPWAAGLPVAALVLPLAALAPAARAEWPTLACIALGATTVGAALAARVAHELRRRVARRAAELETLRALAESRDAHRASDERFRVAFDQAPIGMTMVGPDGVVLRVNAAFERMLGRRAEDMVGRSVDGIIHPDDLSTAREMRDEFLAGDAPSRESVFRLRHHDGHAVWVRITRALVRDRDGRPSYMLGQVEDVTERRRAEAALQASLDRLRQREDQLRRLARRQVAVREEERRRLGFDLHDEVCQDLVGSGIILESVRRRLDAANAGADDALRRVIERLQALAERLRLVARDLRPMLLLDLGLADSLRSLASGLTSEATVVRASCASAVPRLADDVEVGVYRIAQEAVTNALRHASARTVIIRLAIDDDVLRLEVDDDGCGFDLQRPRCDSLGLVSMDERALALEGRLEVSSVPGRGTRVRLVCPATAALPRTAA